MVRIATIREAQSTRGVAMLFLQRWDRGRSKSASRLQLVRRTASTVTKTRVVAGVANRKALRCLLRVAETRRSVAAAAAAAATIPWLLGMWLRRAPDMLVWGLPCLPPDVSASAARRQPSRHRRGAEVAMSARFGRQAAVHLQRQHSRELPPGLASKLRAAAAPCRRTSLGYLELRHSEPAVQEKAPAGHMRETHSGGSIKPARRVSRS
jgi:hypothetical protein